MSNYRHFPGLNRKLSDFKQKNSDQLFSVFFFVFSSPLCQHFLLYDEYLENE